MAAPDTYSVSPRSVVGKNVARLRREGVLPANIYGRGIESVAVELPARQAREMLIAHGTDTLIQLNVEGESKARPVVVPGQRPAAGVPAVMLAMYHGHPAIAELLAQHGATLDIYAAAASRTCIHG